MSQISKQNNTTMLRDIEQEIINEEITNNDFIQALKQVKSSASDKYSIKYKEWTELHGST